MKKLCENDLDVTNVAITEEALNEFIEEMRDPDDEEEFTMIKLCRNHLYVTNVGKNKEALNEFIEAVRDSDDEEEFSPNRIYPCPYDVDRSLMSEGESLRSLLLQVIWCNKNWGTRWCGDGCLTIVDHRRIRYFFLSANTPPTNWLKNVAQKFSDLYFVLKYEEFDDGVMGVCQAHNDKFFDQAISFN